MAVATCKCGKTTVTSVKGLPGSSFEIGCPFCFGSAKAKV